MMMADSAAFVMDPLLFRDPQDATNNVGRSCYAFPVIRQAFAEALDIICRWEPQQHAQAAAAQQQQQQQQQPGFTFLADNDPHILLFHSYFLFAAAQLEHARFARSHEALCAMGLIIIFFPRLEACLEHLLLLLTCSRQPFLK